MAWTSPEHILGKRRRLARSWPRVERSPASTSQRAPVNSHTSLPPFRTHFAHQRPTHSFVPLSFFAHPSLNTSILIIVDDRPTYLPNISIITIWRPRPSHYHSPRTRPANAVLGPPREPPSCRDTGHPKYTTTPIDDQRSATNEHYTSTQSSRTLKPTPTLAS